MAKKKTGISEELREAINEAARAGAYEAYKDTVGAYVNYFKAMETLLYNYKKLAALVANEEAYCEVEYHAGRKTFAAGSKSTGYYEQKTEADIVAYRILKQTDILKNHRDVAHQAFRCYFIHRNTVEKEVSLLWIVETGTKLHHRAFPTS